MFILTLPMWFIMVYFFMNNQPYTPFSLMGITMISGKTLFIFYIVTLMRLLQKEKWQTVLRPFQYVGRMALTNYISHTIVTLLVFGLLFKNDYLAPLWVEYYSASVSTRYKSLLAAGGFHITNTGHLSTFGVLVLTGK